MTGKNDEPTKEEIFTLVLVVASLLSKRNPEYKITDIVAESRIGAREIIKPKSGL